MRPYDGVSDKCPFCGTDIKNYTGPGYALEPFTLLQGKYVLGRVLGVDDFGITYIGWDTNLATYVSVKEYFPVSIAYRDVVVNPGYYHITASEGKKEAYDKGLEIFASEARNMSQFYNLQGKISIKDFFYENSTAYKVEELPAGVYVGTDTPIGSTEAKETKSSSKGKVIAAIILGVIVIALIVLAVILLKDKDKEETDTTVTTEESTDTTEEEKTTETTENTTEEMEEEEAILPGTWTDYKFMINDTIYQLPMTYDEWVAEGWEPMTEEVVLTGGEVRGVRFTSDNIECSVMIANYTSGDAAMEECHVIGFQYCQDYYETYKDSIIRLPGDFCIDTKGLAYSDSTLELEEVYGAADTAFINELGSIYMFTDGPNYLLIYGNGKGLMYEIHYVCFETPEGTEISVGDEAPEQLQFTVGYETPGPTEDRFDDIFKIDGVNYKLFTPLSEFVENGWTIDTMGEEIIPGRAMTLDITKGDARIEVNCSNPTVYTIKPEQAVVTQFNFTEESCQGIEVIFPGGLTFGHSTEVIDALYGSIDEEYPGTYYNYTSGIGYEHAFDYMVSNG
ncbi:MAG: hypothetical protein IJX12_02390, partial [Lachnospiraceae bacterium]|nr:hypothetical protein [Lachnospiraceae bacterium]